MSDPPAVATTDAATTVAAPKRLADVVRVEQAIDVDGEQQPKRAKVLSSSAYEPSAADFEENEKARAEQDWVCCEGPECVATWR